MIAACQLVDIEKRWACPEVAGFLGFQKSTMPEETNSDPISLQFPEKA